VHSTITEPHGKQLRFYRPELDLLRLLAFVMVFLHHTIPYKYVTHLPLIIDFTDACGAGLQLFFVLSSYLITELLLREHKNNGTVHVRAFFIRRILRIWPLYFAFIGGCMLARIVFHAGVFPLPAFFAYILLAGNWYVYTHGFLPFTVGPLWSVSLEEQYYLIWPFVARAGHKRALWAASGIFFIGAYVTLYYLGDHLAPRYAVWTNSFVEFQFFAIGAVLALALHGREIFLPLWVRPILLALSVASIGFAASHFQIFRDDPRPFRDLFPGYLLLGSGIVLLFLAFLRAPVPSFCKPLVFLGKISYGLYVFYTLSFLVQKSVLSYFGLIGSANVRMLAARTVISLFFCIAFAMISYNFLEMPFLRMKRRFTFVRARDE
jgi:peptidoglycan/LPS O-acetylase OafA/YrhL